MKKIKFIALGLLLVLMPVMLTACKKETETYDFTDDIIIVVLTAEATADAYANDKVYGLEDFPELNLSRVNDLDMQYENIHPVQKRILFLYLQEPSHERVLEYIEMLKSRADIESASPNHIHTGGV